MSSTDLLLDVTTAAQLFHASDGAGFADLIIDGHRETWPLRGKRFQTWLRQQYYERTWDAPSPAALNAAVKCARGAGSVRWTAAQGLSPHRRARRPDLPRSGG